MRLHENTKLFSDTIRAASQNFGIKQEFIEKDYWITIVLSRLAKSDYFDKSVFKGGTSLSKGFNLIDRFSEDVDIALIDDKLKTGNEIKTIIRNIEKGITQDLREIEMSGVTSKGSRFRKSVFEYIPTDKNNRNNKLIVEVNSFANPFPFQELPIKSFVFDFLIQTENAKYITEYNLQPFKLNVLNKVQTLMEKLASLIRFSFSEIPAESISGKIRHFYDLFFLMQNSECAEFYTSDTFKTGFDEILQHDRVQFDEPLGWQNKSVAESPLVNNFEAIWKILKIKYQSELSALAYRPIPDEERVAEVFQALTAG
ncbi:nucleotidyl transferase AbiEii/AbiGii toxin family protein [soil metagenome]